jgi:hypothetical protein
MTETILLIIVILIITAISIGIYLYTLHKNNDNDNDNDSKPFTDRENKIIDTSSSKIDEKITDLKLEDTYLKKNEFESKISENTEKVKKIIDNSPGIDIGEGQYQYIMQDLSDDSNNKIELRNKVNIVNDFNICNEEENICYKFNVDKGNLNIVKIDDDDSELSNGKIFFKNQFKLYNDNEIEENKYFNGPNKDSTFIATPYALNNQSFDVQKHVYSFNYLKSQFLITPYIEINPIDSTEKSKSDLDSEKKYYIKIDISENKDNNDFKYYTIFPFSKLLQPVLEYNDPDPTKGIVNKIMDYTDNGSLIDYSGSDLQSTSSSPIIVYKNPSNPSDNTIYPAISVTIKYIVKSDKRS